MDVIGQSPKLMRMKKLLNKNKRKLDDSLVIKHNKEILDLFAKKLRNHKKS